MRNTLFHFYCGSAYNCARGRLASVYIRPAIAASSTSTISAAVGTIAMPSSSAGSIVFLSGVNGECPEICSSQARGDAAFDAADGSVLWSHS